MRLRLKARAILLGRSQFLFPGSVIGCGLVDYSGNFPALLRLVLQCLFAARYPLAFFQFDALQSLIAGLEALLGKLGRLTLRRQFYHFSLAVSEPLDQGNVAGTDKVTTAEFNTRAKTVGPGIFPLTIPDLPV